MFFRASASIVLFLLSFLILFLSHTTHSIDVAVYWGNNKNDNNDKNLTKICASGIYSIVNIAALIDYESVIDEAATPLDYENPALTPPLAVGFLCAFYNCSLSGGDIKNCQKQGIKVLLSLAIGVSNLSSSDPKSASDYLWDNFLGGGRNSSSRPLGEVILDGIDFAITDSSSLRWDEVARYLKSHSTKTQYIYLSAKARCPFPDYALGKSLETGLFDYVWIQYYDNPSCGYDEGNVSGLFTSWNKWTTLLKTEKVFLGLAASPDDVNEGYIPIEVLTSQILGVVNKSSNYGGVMLSSSYDDQTTGYSKAIPNNTKTFLNDNKTISENNLCGHNIEFRCERRKNGFVERFGHMATNGFVVSTKNGSIDGQCCEAMCRNNCSCDAFGLLDFGNHSTGCQLWSRGTRFIKGSVGNLQRVYIVKQRVVRKWWIWLISGVGAAVTVFALYSVFSRKYKAAVDRKIKRKKLLAEVRGNAMENYANAKKTIKDGKTIDEIQEFNLETLIATTNNFSHNNKLGEGGFGPVYKGELIDGQKIAIKRLSKSSGQGLSEFKNEANIMAKLQHTNLVRLVGFCIERDERMLIYEYMCNKSLDFYLFDASRKNLLDWKKRLNIIEGIAQGLVYLHKYSRIKVIHRDLKPSNILLDEVMNPKISDFGMARIFGLKGPQENTNRVVETYGYMSPEYAISGVVSVKTDVYSFGVMLLEIISEMKNNSLIHLSEPFNLMGHAWKLWNENRALELIDPSLKESYDTIEVLRCIHIGLLCVQDHPTDRPTTQDVVSFLSNYALQLGQPKKPAFFVSGVKEESGLPGSKQETYSIYGASISTIYGR